MKKTTSKRLAAAMIAILAASQLAACGGDDNDAPAPTTPPVGDTGGGDTGGGDTGGGDTGGGDTGGGDNGGGDTGGDTGGGDTGGDTGGGDTGGGDDTQPVSEGFFIDAPVQGLTYNTSPSGLTGVTNAEGRYEYRAGDTVTFSVGAFVLGAVPAQGVVTPKTVADAVVAQGGDAANVAVNMLVLLQSLDANGDPEDGVTIAPEIQAAIAAQAIDVTADAGAFTSALNSLIPAIAAEAETTLAVRSREDAQSHFVGQSSTALAGVYLRADENFQPITQKAVALTIMRSGRYLVGGRWDQASCNIEQGGTPTTSLAFSDANGDGVEFGAMHWDPLTGEFSVSGIIRETDGLCGFNEPLVGATNDVTRMEMAPEGLVFIDSEGQVVHRFARTQRTETLAGTWAAPGRLLQVEPIQITFFPSADNDLQGRYLLVDATRPYPETDESPGIEEGCYSVNDQRQLSIELDPAVCADAIDTNNTAGASGDDALELFVDENDRLVIADGEDWTGFARLPMPTLTMEALAGAWIVQSAPGVQPAQEPAIQMLTVLESGRFIFGTQHDDPTCAVAGYPAPDQDPDGNGVEFGELSLTASPGLVTPVTTVDTNGECGLTDALKEFQQRYFVAPARSGDALVIWANDEVEDMAGFVFKRVPNVANSLTGAWLWVEEVGEGMAVSAYLPGGVMFEANLFPGETGVKRELFEYNAETEEMSSQLGGFDYCVDTVSDECGTDPSQRLIETYIVEGDVIRDDEGETVIRIPAP